MEDEEPKTQPEPDKEGPGRFPPTRIGAAATPLFQFVCYTCKKFVTEAHPALPYMSPHICMNCIRKGIVRPIRESEISNKALAPWTDDEVKLLNRYQKSSKFLPFICNDWHPLAASRNGLFCEQCPEFSLSWTYPWILNGSWKNDL